MPTPSAVMVENMLHEEAKEGIGAFQEKGNRAGRELWPACPSVAVLHHLYSEHLTPHHLSLAMRASHR